MRHFNSIGFTMLILPVIDPLRHSSAVAVDITVLFAIQFHHNFLVKSLAGLLEKDAKDLRVQVLLEFVFVVPSRQKKPLESIIHATLKVKRTGKQDGRSERRLRGSGGPRRDRSTTWERDHRRASQSGTRPVGLHLRSHPVTR